MEIFSNGRLVLWAALLAMLAGCSQDARLSSALLVNVTVDSSSKAQCIRVLVRPGSGGEQATDGIAVKDELRVAVYRGEGWSTDVTVLARGYDDCSKPVNQFIEETAPKSANFPGSGTELVSLVLKGAEDADHDGFASPQDCNDSDATVHPGANELCTDTVDKNCSGTTGCADLACVGPCGSNGEGACVQGVCKATTEVDCTDGQDNDSDFLIDCQDPDCRNKSCDDKSACTTGETCQSNGQCAAPTSTVACNTPPGQCFETAGTCNPLDAGCTYTVTTGSCDDGNPCTTGETCQSDGSCGAPTGAVTCNTPPGQCFETAGTCNPQDGGCTYTVTTGSCDDQSACTTGETCNSVGACVPTFTEQCANPPGQCYQSAGQSSCDPVDGGCNYTVRTGGCDDNNACTVGETCQTNGTCGAPTSNVTCNTPPGQCYASAGSCNPADGTCSYSPRTGTCDDGNACTSGESCSNGTCGSPTSTVQCNTPPGQCYVATGTCNPANGTCSYAVRTGACDDGNACTTGETCQPDGTCSAPTSTVSCTTPPGQCYASSGTCNPADGTCSYSPRTGSCDDGNACTTGETCSNGTCGAPTSTVTCTTPPSQCFANSGTCNPADGTCSYGVRSGSCDDQNACTSGESCQLDGGCGAPSNTVTCTTPPGQCFASAGTCNPSNGACDYDVRVGTCDDQSACTTGESCQTDGGCGAPTTTVSCNTPPGQCFASSGTCDPSNGACSYGVRTGTCDDQSACTTGESCQTDGGCGAPTTTVSCNTPPGQCFASAGTCDPSNGACSYGVRTGTCDDLSACTSGESCLIDGGCGAPTTTVSCNTPPGQCFASAGTCDPSNGACSYGVNTGASCDDQSACTSGESCQNDGGCGAPTSTVSCNTPPGQCFASTGSCNSSNGSCSYGVITGSCNDGNACTTGDSCQTDGGCAGPTPVICSAANPCFDAGVCDPGTGCPTPQPMVGAACDDSNTCTLGESCDSSGNCGTPVSTTTCTPNECQSSGSCLSDAGCSFVNKTNGTACTNGTCVSGSCIPVTQFTTYVPANFTPDSSKVTGPLTVNCALSWNTDGANPTFATCLSGESLSPQVITQKSSTVDAVIIHVSSLNVTSAGSITVTGARPLIIAVYGTADVAGTIDVSATGSTSGAGAGLACGAATSGTMTSGNGGTGAGGGGNSAAGGQGGRSSINANPAGGSASTNGTTISPLAGGCRGGNGGAITAGNTPAGGGGGGAVQISASAAVHLSGSIYASGGGGRAGGFESTRGQGGAGGGGAGSVLLEGNTVSLTATAVITANGGSGGEGGAGIAAGAAGVDGPKGTRTAATTTDSQITGGNGGNGGAGATLSGAAGAAAGTNGGGGGGGGAAGKVTLRSPTEVCRLTGHVISPSNAGNATIANGFTINSPSSTSSNCP